MAHNNKLYRNFIILQEDEKNISNSEKPLSGYSKIESKGDKCKVTFYAQNLKKEDNYSIVLICAKGDLKQIVDMGSLKIGDSGKSEASKEYYADNIAGIDMSYEKISGAGIGKHIAGKIEIVMYGFMNGEKPDEAWKNYKVVKCDDSKANKVKEKPIKKEPKEETPKKTEHKQNKNDVSKDAFDCYERSIEVEEVDPENFKIRGGIGDFFEGIVKGFEEVKDCFKEITYCKWFKVPVKTIDDMCDASDYNKYSIVYNPMMNYYPYIVKAKHFMIGYKCDKTGSLKYIVYAIAGKKSVDEQPYMGKSGFVTWVKGKDEDNGFWLMFYDYKKSAVVVPTK